MILTLKEQKVVLNMVMESHKDITLTEAKTNVDIREEMRLNLKFYNSLKEGFIKNNNSQLNEGTGLFSHILSVLGNIKDFLTGTKLIKNITQWVKDLVEKITLKLKPIIDTFIPKPAQDFIKWASTSVANFIKWIYNTLSYKGIAKLFAMIRYKTFRPSNEQKKCMELAAKKVYKWILYTLIAAFLIKVLVYAWPLIIGAESAAVASAGIGIQLPGFLQAFAPLTAFITKIGGKSLIKGIFSIFSTAIKTKDSMSLDDDIESIEKQHKDKELDGFGEAWNQCKISQK